METQNLLSLIGPVAFPSSFDLSLGRRRYLALKALNPNSAFLIPPPGAPNGTVGLEACYLLAGAGRGAYGRGVVFDCITTWVIPLFLLVGNVNYASFRKEAYWNQVLTAAHFVGNPIDAIWSLLAKLDAGRRIRNRCKDELRHEKGWVYATILVALDDFGFGDRFEDRFQQLKSIALSNKRDAKQACRRAAIDLTAPRVNNTRRALLAVSAYFATVTSAFGRAGFSDNVQMTLPHLIALRELFYWLIPVVVLSAKTGGFPSEWTSLSVLTDLQEKTGLDFSLRRLEPWTGGVYSWRPIKDNSQSISGSRDQRCWALLGLSLLCVTGAAATSFTMSYLTPTRGIGPRGVVELCYTSAWIFNAMVAYIVELPRRRAQSGKKRWLLLVTLLDIPIALSTVLVLFLAFQGKPYLLATLEGDTDG